MRNYKIYQKAWDYMKEEMITFAEGNEPYKVKISALLVGDDLVVIVRGGEEPHVGAVAVSIPRPSLANAEETVLQLQFYSDRP